MGPAFFLFPLDVNSAACDLTNSSRVTTRGMARQPRGGASSSVGVEGTLPRGPLGSSGRAKCL